MGQLSVKERVLIGLVAALAITTCSTVATRDFDKLYGKSDPRERVVATLPPGQVDYWSEVKPLIDRRCVVCHGCYDAPCQLKMSSIEGIERGANPERVYDQSRLRQATPTRLFDDADGVAQWREMGFHPVLSEYPDAPEANREASVMYRMLQLKQQNPLPDSKHLPDSFKLGLSRKEVCTQADAFDQYANDYPLWGMPYALPGLAADERKTLMTWVEQGATYTRRAGLSPDLVSLVAKWEAFLNGPELKQQLASRYIYEHLSYAHLYFPDADEQRFFDLVRSTTPPGEAIEVRSTRRPYDDPGVGPVYYRLREVVGSIVEKTHLPYALDTSRMARWQSLFIDPDYEVTSLPSRASEFASNPFVTFEAIPVESRYKFMLDEAHFTINAFIKGPVCRGEVAVDVINDHFWVFFTNPDSKLNKRLETFLSQSGQSLELPASTEAIYQPVKRWRQYKKQQATFLQQKDEFLAKLLDESAKIRLDGIWDGDGSNQNASLTVIRHFDNATVKKGLLGQSPKTAWVIDYSLLERIHYLLVAGYDVYGNVGHQLDTRLYMDFLRMEGEANFLLMLPGDARRKERDFWYRNTDDELKAYVSSPVFEKRGEPGIEYHTDDPKQELYGLLKQRLSPVQPVMHLLSSVDEPGLAVLLEPLNQISGAPVNVLPENMFLQVSTSHGDDYFTLVSNTAYANMSAVFGSGRNRMPEEDTLTAYRGFIGAYPNVLLAVEESDVAEFVTAMGELENEGDYQHLLDDYGLRRTDPEFWRHSDAFHAGSKALDPLNYGLFDYNRLENR